MKTTSTGSPKVKKVTSTQPKKRGRPVGSKKAILLPEYPEVAKFITGKIKEEIRIDKALHELPDSEATVEQVKSWVKIEDINGKIKVGTKGYTKLDRLDIDLVDGVLQLKGKTPTNYWKYACVAILLGIVTAMILSTPLFVKLAEVCSQ